jgi:small multidrug resistance pump
VVPAQWIQVTDGLRQQLSWSNELSRLSAVDRPGIRLVAVSKWWVLAGAIVTEVAATLSLRASQDHAAWLAVVVVGYLAAFALLTMVLRAGVPVGVAYGIWGAVGTAVTAVLGAVIFDDPFTWAIAAGIGLIIAGVLLVELGSRPDERVGES